MFGIDQDLNEIVTRAADDLQELSGARIFITGGTGYIGRWLLAAIFRANHVMNLDVQITVLTRDFDKFAAEYPQLAEDEAATWIGGDIRDFSWPSSSFSHAIHGATDVVAVKPPLQTYDVIANGSRQVIDFCKERKIDNILLLSSGAIYGTIPDQIERVTEDFKGSVELMQASSAYALGKMVMEWQAAALAAESGLSCKIARIFAQVGPSMTLDKHFAVGNFLADVILGRKFRIEGDGTPLRSYMYSTDLVVWLLAILVRGQTCTPYNVGSDQPVSIIELTKHIAAVANIAYSPPDILKKPDNGLAPNRYVPDTTRVRMDLEMKIAVGLEEALARSFRWHLKSLKEGCG